MKGAAVNTTEEATKVDLENARLIIQTLIGASNELATLYGPLFHGIEAMEREVERLQNDLDHIRIDTDREIAALVREKDAVDQTLAKARRLVNALETELAAKTAEVERLRTITGSLDTEKWETLEAELAARTEALREIGDYTRSCLPFVKPNTKAEVLARRVTAAVDAALSAHDTESLATGGPT